MASVADQDLAGAIVETISQPLIVLDRNLHVRSANQAFLDRFHVGKDHTEGVFLYDVGNGQWNIEELRELLEDVLTEDEPVTGYRVEHMFPDLGRRAMLLNARRIKRSASEDLILLAISDVTEQEQAQWELEGLKEYAEKVVDAVRDPLLVLTWDLHVRSANEPFYEMFRVKPQETEGRLVYELGNGQWDIAKLRELLEDILPSNSTFNDFLVEHEFQDIGCRTMLLNARRIDHEQLILLAIEDVTERRRAESRQNVLVGELQHRVKNILMNVRTLARASYLGSKDREEFLSALDGRLDALGRSQDLLVKSPKSAVSLTALINLELQAANATERARVKDCDVVIPARLAQPMAMTIHELTTNAIKYGALSGDTGTISIACEIRITDDGDVLWFCWRERGAEIEDRNPKSGFGTKVIQESLPYLLGGSSNLVFHPDGAECTMEVPLGGEQV